MRPRTYALALSAIATSLFLAVAAANVVIDPVGVFGTNVFPPGSNSNERYLRFSAYQARSDRYDALLFGSSRSQWLPLDDLSRHMAGATLANFGVAYGMLSDHLPVLEYLLRHQAPDRKRIREIFLLLDADSFGIRPHNDESLAFALPPALSGEHPARFWWRNLVAIQVQAWRGALKEALDKWRPSQSSGHFPERTRRDVSSRMVATFGAGAARADGLPNPATGTAKAAMLESVTERPGYRRHLELWSRFVSLCREHDIHLLVAVSPLSHATLSGLNRSDLLKAVDDLARLAPVWDFTDAGWVSDDPTMWRDGNHFTMDVGGMIVARVFGDEMPSRWAEFGHFHPQQNVVVDAR